MGMRVGKQPPVADEHRFDAGGERLATSEAFFLAREEFEHDERGVVETHYEGAPHPMRLPLCFNQIGTLNGRVGVLPGLIRVALSDVFEIEAWDQFIPKQRV